MVPATGAWTWRPDDFGDRSYGSGEDLDVDVDPYLTPAGVLLVTTTSERPCPPD